MIVASVSYLGAMLTDQASIAIFVVATVVLAAVAVLVAPSYLVRLGMRRLVPALAVIGSLLSVVLILVGAGTMALSGHPVELLLIMALAVSAATVVLGRRLATPITNDMQSVSAVIHELAQGNRAALKATATTREAQRLLEDVEMLRSSLLRSELERDRSEQTRRATVAALSHDLRTPLHSMIAATEALEDGIGSPERNLTQLRLNVNAIDQLVTDLFLVAQAEAGTLRFECHPVDVAEVIDEVVEAVQPTGTARGVEVTASAFRSLIVHGDELAIGRILRNLIDNAIRHTPAGGAVGVGASPSADGWVHLEVSDEGPGLPPGLSDSNGAGAVTGGLRDHGGVGLGLTIATSLAHAAGGQVRALPGPPGRVIVSLRAATV